MPSKTLSEFVSPIKLTGLVSITPVMFTNMSTKSFNFCMIDVSALVRNFNLRKLFTFPVLHAFKRLSNSIQIFTAKHKERTYLDEYYMECEWCVYIHSSDFNIYLPE